MYTRGLYAQFVGAGVPSNRPLSLAHTRLIPTSVYRGWLGRKLGRETYVYLFGRLLFSCLLRGGVSFGWGWVPSFVVASFRRWPRGVGQGQAREDGQASSESDERKLVSVPLLRHRLPKP